MRCVERNVLHEPHSNADREMIVLNTRGPSQGKHIMMKTLVKVRTRQRSRSRPTTTGTSIGLGAYVSDGESERGPATWRVTSAVRVGPRRIRDGA